MTYREKALRSRCSAGLTPRRELIVEDEIGIYRNDARNVRRD